MNNFDFGVSLNEIDIGPPSQVSDFISAMAEKGFVCHDLNGPTGNTVHRFSRNGNGGDKNCYAVLFNDGILAGGFGDFSTNEYHKWCAKGLESLSVVESMELEKRLNVAQKKRKETQEKKKKIAAKTATNKLKGMDPAKKDHPYCVKKGIFPVGSVFQEKDLLHIPAYNSEGNVQTYQTINGEGKKRFLKGGTLKGCFFPIGTQTDSVYLCEGYATGATIYELTSKQVFVAFDAGNMLAVAKWLKSQNMVVTVAADNDCWKKSNTGLDTAKKIKEMYGFSYVYPEFSPEQGLLTPTDFNDLAAFNKNVAREQLLPTEGEQIAFSIGDLMDAPPKPIDVWWNSSGLFNNCRFLLAGAPKAGKSTFLWSLVTTAAYGGIFLNAEFSRPLKTLLINAEVLLPFMWKNLQPFLKPDHIDLIRKNFIITGRTTKQLEKPADKDWLQRLVASQSPDIVVLDPIVNLSTVNENDSGEVRSLLDTTTNLIKQTSDAALIVCHHTKKQQMTKGENPFDFVRGSSYWTGWTDTAMMITGRDNERMLHYQFRNTLEPACHGLSIDREQGEVSIRFDESIAAERDSRIEILMLQKFKGGVKYSELKTAIMEQENIGATIANEAIKKAIDSGLIYKEGRSQSKDAIYKINHFGGI